MKNQELVNFIKNRKEFQKAYEKALPRTANDAYTMHDFAVDIWDSCEQFYETKKDSKIIRATCSHNINGIKIIEDKTLPENQCELRSYDNDGKLLGLVVIKNVK